jgi:hypothetical protein
VIPPAAAVSSFRLEGNGVMKALYTVTPNTVIYDCKYGLDSIESIRELEDKVSCPQDPY